MDIKIFNNKDDFNTEIIRQTEAGNFPSVRGRKLYVGGVIVAEYRSPNWGGSRGGGRPTNDRSIPFCVRISPEALQKINSLNVNKSEFIDRLIKDY